MKTSFLGLLTLVPASLLLLASASQAAPLTGNTLTCSTSPVFIFSCSAPTAVAGAGVEFTLTSGNNSLTADFTGTDLILTNPAASNLAFTTNFGPGITLSFADPANPFTQALLVSSTVPSFTAANISLVAGVLNLSVSGVQFTGGRSIDINLVPAATAAVPEPTSLMLLGTGVVGLLGAARRRSSKA